MPVERGVGGVFAIVIIRGLGNLVSFVRDGFAAHAGGYVRLYANGSTSKDKCGIDTLLFEKPLHVDRLGRLCDASVTGAKALEAPKVALLTNGQ